jgi:FKBP-type peptidyl-prolyl cis-trans isomerase 2
MINKHALLGPWQFFPGLSISHLRVHAFPFILWETIMAQAQSGDTVQVHYTGKLDDGTTFDTSMQREPLEFTLGAGELIPGFEQAVLGMSPGESKTATIPTDQAYGRHRPERVLEVDRNQLPATLQPQVGQQLQMTRPDGQAIDVVITAVTDAQVMLDANHPLAGKELIFDITLVAIV